MSAESLKKARPQPAGPQARPRAVKEGWEGWDEYAPFYDWENARTLGTRDVAFWLRAAAEVRGRVLELGCGTGRLSLPLARSGVSVVGVDRSSGMLAHAARRVRRLEALEVRRGHRRPLPLTLVRGDIRMLPFASGQFAMVLAPYGVLQSLVSDADLAATLDAVARVLAPGGRFGIDLVPDVPRWREYRDRLQMRGRAGRRRLTLVESVRQDRRRRLTIFEQRYIERPGPGRSATEHRFELVFRTLPMRGMARRIERAGFVVEQTLGDYRGGPWDPDAETWLILARR